MRNGMRVLTRDGLPERLRDDPGQIRAVDFLLLLSLLVDVLCANPSVKMVKIWTSTT